MNDRNSWLPTRRHGGLLWCRADCQESTSDYWKTLQIIRCGLLYLEHGGKVIFPVGRVTCMHVQLLEYIASASGILGLGDTACQLGGQKARPNTRRHFGPPAEEVRNQDATVRYKKAQRILSQIHSHLNGGTNILKSAIQRYA